jgi:hypothetical protein
MATKEFSIQSEEIREKEHKLKAKQQKDTLRLCQVA